MVSESDLGLSSAKGSSDSLNTSSHDVSLAKTTVNEGENSTPKINPAILTHLKSSGNDFLTSNGVESMEVVLKNTMLRRWSDSNSKSEEFISDTNQSEGIVSCHDFFTPPPHQGKLVDYSNTRDHQVGGLTSSFVPSIHDQYPMMLTGLVQFPVGITGGSIFSHNQSLKDRGMISSSSMDLPNSNYIPNSLIANPQGHSVLPGSFIPGESKGQLHFSNMECHKSSSVYSSKGSSDMEDSKG